ncbi:AAA family ATPase [Pseudoalteromonas sp. NSLLW24]|uniref:P-loop ATPase, Sll1717 family n=1 Tax=Pseudoalteromonas sp. NSLLW24 TaxID=2792050 RepID=UPI0018CF2795|nr:AAA family ATPase [Pseudoalteromonas sp. NSLLW24]MBG9999560.1 AAA family ATPase [Pseudoalteromonas sp. NSLLW24]
MKLLNIIKKIQECIQKYPDINYRIINNTIGKNVILLSLNDKNLINELKKSFSKHIQEIIIETDEDEFLINEIKSICNENQIVHRNVSYIKWHRKATVKSFDNVIAGYSFKGGMGRSSTIAYLSYYYYLIGKKVAVLDCDFEAPGIASMFFERSERNGKSGILDYLVDLNMEDEPKLNDYFIQSEVSNSSGNLYIFPSGINSDTTSYIDKISKIDFNSTNYSNSFIKLLKHINSTLKPDVIFIDLRAGINESNGLVLNDISGTNLLFFNSEEQNEDGLNVVLNSIGNYENNFIMNSTIRFSSSDVRSIKEKALSNYLSDNFKAFSKDHIIPIPFHPILLESNIDDFKNFVSTQFEISKAKKDTYLSSLINVIGDRLNLKNNGLSLIKKNDEVIDEVNLDPIFKKLENVFSRLTGTEQFKNDDDSKFFYLKEDLSKIVNEQIFLILGAKGSGKSTLFEMFTKPHQAILKKLNTKNNSYIAGFSKPILNDLTQDHLSLILQKSVNKILDIKRFWKCLTLFQLENQLQTTSKYFNDINNIVESFNTPETGISVDERLKSINIELYQSDKSITLVYDELDIGFSDTEYRQIFITALVSYWQDNIYKFSQIRSKILLRNDIFSTLSIENKTHLDLNKYELQWSEKEILSLILNTFISALSWDELEAINLSGIVKTKNPVKNEVLDDIDEIRAAMYLIFDRKLAGNRPSMDKWIMTRLADAQGLITPRVIYKFMSESIKHERALSHRTNKKHLLTSFSKNNTSILKKVSEHKLVEYRAEYPECVDLFVNIQKIGQRTFSFEEFKKSYQTPNKASTETVLKGLNMLINSGFILISDERLKKYQVAYVYLYALGLKINRSNTGKKRKK